MKTKTMELLKDQTNDAENSKKKSIIGLCCFGTAALVAAYKAIECAYTYGVTKMHLVWCKNMTEGLKDLDEE